MKQTAVEAAHKCPEGAREALSSMKRADSYERLESAWSDFLTKANRVYTKLEQGAKGNNTSYAWWGRKRHERKQDSLLSYIKNARDADEHGLEKITQRASGGIGVGFPGQDTVTIKRGRIGGGKIELELEDPNIPVQVTAYPSSVKLIEVTNYGDKYPSPQSHKGQPIARTHPFAHPNPITVAELTISHLSDLVDEAAKLKP